MEVSFYTTHSNFEFLPSISLSKCTAETIHKRAYNLMFSLFTLVLELAWEVDLKVQQ